MVMSEKTGQNIRRIRQTQGITMEQAAVWAKLARQTLWMAEQGLASEKTLKAIAKVLKVSVADLTGEVQQ
jgi:transcriptional regulator with XRE-family HTH domain